MGTILRNNPDGTVWFEEVTPEQEAEFRAEELVQWPIVLEKARIEQEKADEAEAKIAALLAQFLEFTDDEIRQVVERRGIMMELPDGV